MAPTRTYSDLEAHNVHIVHTIVNRNSPELPQHIRAVQTRLLCFDAAIPIEWTQGQLDAQGKPEDYFLTNRLERLGDDDDVNIWIRKGYSLLPPENAIFGDWQPRDKRVEEQHQHGHEEVRQCKDIANEFQTTNAPQDHEDNLTDYYRFGIFRTPLEMLQSIREKREAVWRLHRNLPWSEQFACFERGPDIAASKPDLYYGLKTVRSSHDPMIPAQNHNHKAYDNLKIKFLTYARQKHDVSSGVTTALKKAGCMEKLRVDKLSHHDLTSFPFAVVELKRKHTPAAGIVTCECQAASASARALSLHRTLYMKSHWGRSDYHERDGYDIPPCVAFTCIGTSVRVWLVYEESRRKDAKVVMQCIFATNTVLTWGVIALRRLVSNMLEWAKTDYRETIVTALQYLKRDYPQEEESTVLSTTQEDTAVSPSDSSSEHESEHIQASSGGSSKRSNHEYPSPASLIDDRLAATHCNAGASGGVNTKGSNEVNGGEFSNGAGDDDNTEANKDVDQPDEQNELGEEEGTKGGPPVEINSEQIHLPQHEYDSSKAEGVLRQKPAEDEAHEILDKKSTGEHKKSRTIVDSTNEASASIATPQSTPRSCSTPRSRDKASKEPEISPPKCSFVFSMTPPGQNQRSRDSSYLTPESSPSSSSIFSERSQPSRECVFDTPRSSPVLLSPTAARDTGFPSFSLASGKGPACSTNPGSFLFSSTSPSRDMRSEGSLFSTPQREPIFSATPPSWFKGPKSSLSSIPQSEDGTSATVPACFRAGKSTERSTTHTSPGVFTFAPSVRATSQGPMLFTPHTLPIITTSAASQTDELRKAENRSAGPELDDYVDNGCTTPFTFDPKTSLPRSKSAPRERLVPSRPPHVVPSPSLFDGRRWNESSRSLGEQPNGESSVLRTSAEAAKRNTMTTPGLGSVFTQRPPKEFEDILEDHDKRRKEGPSRESLSRASQAYAVSPSDSDCDLLWLKGLQMDERESGRDDSIDEIVVSSSDSTYESSDEDELITGIDAWFDSVLARAEIRGLEEESSEYPEGWVRQYIDEEYASSPEILNYYRENYG